ncbi:MAG: OmpA family protein, partial [Muribaculaceae bacterium]|nr:OmpA family protein [Muribaculaceae bacterium]
MKKSIIAAICTVALGATAAQAQVVDQPGFGDNWSVGADGGVTTPLKGGAFFGNMRGAAGLRLGKQITPVFGLGVESLFGVNTSSWRGHHHSSTAFDNSYIGVYG